MKKYTQSRWDCICPNTCSVKKQFGEQKLKGIVAIILFLLIHLSTSAQVYVVKNLFLANTFEAIDNKILFNGHDGVNQGLFVSDGTLNGTLNIPSVPSFGDMYTRCRIGNLIYYTTQQTELWKTDGTIAGTILVKDGLLGATNLVNLNSILIFTQSTATGTELWRSDGTNEGTYQIIDLGGNNDGVTSSLLQTAVYNGYLYFSGPNSALWKTDGTSVGTSEVVNGGFQPSGFNLINNKLIYRSYETYTFDCNGSPTTATGHVIRKIETTNNSILKEPVTISGCNKGVTFSNSESFAKAGNYLYFRGEQSGSNELWRTDGTTEGTIQLTSFSSNALGEGLENFFWQSRGKGLNFDKIFYCPVNTADNGIELWRSDGTPEGTFLLKDINVGTGGSNPKEFRTVNGITYFYANTGNYAMQLWQSDGTINGTRLVDAVNSAIGLGVESGTGTGLENRFGINLGNKYYFIGSQNSSNGLFFACSSPVPTISSSTSPICLGASATLTASGCGGTINWSTGATGSSIIISPTSSASYTATCTENDCQVSLTASYEITVNPVPIVSVNSQTICSGNNTTLTASNCTGNVTWNTGASGSVLSLSNVNTTTTYTATCTLNGCTATSTGMVTVNPTPSVTVNNQTICSGSNTTLTASNCTGNVTWNTGASGSVLSLSNMSTTTTYSATCTLGSCTATNTGTVTVNTVPTVSVNSQTICSGSNTNLTASTCAGNVTWNTGASGSVLNLTNIITTTSYTATCTLNGCTATSTGTVTVNPTPTVTVNNQTICSGNNTTLTASNCSGTVSWNTGAIGSVLNLTNISTTTTYTATCTLGSCTTTNTGTVTVKPLPIVTVNSQTICSGSNTTLTASTCTGDVTWNTGASGSVLSLTNVITTTTYTATCTLNGCTAINTGTVTVNPIPTVSVNSQTICSGGNTTLTASTCTGNITWNTGASGSVLSLSNISTTTTYTATCTLNGCTASNTGTVTVNPTPNVSVNNQTICTGSNTSLTASNCIGTVSWNTGASGSVLTLTNVTASGTYMATCTLGSCTAISTGTVTVNQTLSVSVNNQTICTGSNTSLTASNCAGNVTWNTGASGSVLTLTNVTANATYTATCTLGDCLSSNTGTVTVNPIPTVSVNSQTICSGGNTTLTASACIGNITWNTGASGSVLSLSNVGTTTTYTATCTLNGCTASNTGTVTVNPTPTITVNNQTICTGSNTSLTASNCIGTVSWNTGASGSVLTLNNVNTTTTYTATCTLGSCTATSTGAVTVSSIPTVSVNNQTICSGTNTVLTATTCLGTITWNTGASGSTLSLTNIITTTNYTATCTIGSCTASSIGTVTVNQSPTVNTITAQEFYSGNNTPVISFSGSNPNSIYTWTNDNPSIGLAAGGTGNIPTFVAINSGVNPQVANISVTPSTSSPNCPGASKTFTITVIRAASGTITQMEYFIDADPGYGNGVSVSFTAGNPVTVNFPISLSASSDGFHFLTLRAKDADNNWGIVAIRPFYKETIPTASLPNIIAMEYFIDNDLGYGLCTPVTGLVPNTSVSQSFQIPLNNTLSDGFHFLSLRAKDANNNWTIVAVRPFYKETITNASIAQMEYFIDNDPGTNNGTNVSITGNNLFSRDNNTPTSSSTNVGFAFLPSNISNGTHKLSIRVRDTNNNWGIVQIKEFTVQDNTIVVNNSPAQWCANTSFNIPFTVTGTYTSGNTFTAQLSDINGSFTNPINIGTLTATTAGTVAANIPTGTTLSDNYQIRVISSTPSITNTDGKTFKLISICPPPCVGLLTLIHPSNDILSGNISQQASAINGNISASNYVQGNGTRATYQAKSITLTNGFRADRGVVFKAEVGGCNN